MCNLCLGRKGTAVLREEARDIIWLRVSSSLPHLGLTFFSAQSLTELLLIQFAQNSWENTSFPVHHSISGIACHHFRKSFSCFLFSYVISYGSGSVEITTNLLVRGYAGCSGISRVFLQPLEGGRDQAVCWRLKALIFINREHSQINWLHNCFSMGLGYPE